MPRRPLSLRNFSWDSRQDNGGKVERVSGRNVDEAVICSSEDVETTSSKTCVFVSAVASDVSRFMRL